MSIAESFFPTYEFNRTRTLGLLDTILKDPDPMAALGRRPGPGRAHIAWQLMHIGITEELFATERLAPEKKPLYQDLWPRFRGGSTPDDDIPSPELIRKVLDDGRRSLLETLRGISDERMNEIPPALAERKLTIKNVLFILGWHEPHHQGQAHITYNLYKAAAGR